MNCIKCGQPLTEGAKFCSACGARVEQQQNNAFCSTCGTKLEPSARFCPICGVMVGPTGQTTGQTVGQTTEQATEQTAEQMMNNSMITASGRLISSFKMFSMYEGTPTVGLAKASGPLSVYDDRIEFKKHLGNALGGAFGLVGMSVAKNKVKNDPVEIYPLSQIAQLRVGKYGGIYNTLVMVLRDGTTLSFCPAAPGSSTPQNIINSLQPYLR